jgi:hypothetical protein
LGEITGFRTVHDLAWRLLFLPRSVTHHGTEEAQMQIEAWSRFATNDVRAMDRSPELLADAFVDAFSVRDVDPPVCIECLSKALRRSTGEIVDEVMSMYASFDVTLNDSGTCRLCARRTVVVG